MNDAAADALKCSVQVTILVTLRERFSLTERCLQTIYEQTDYPFQLIFVSAAAPPHIQCYLEAQASQRAFLLLSTPKYLSPNEARNWGLSAVKTKYVVFLDNDTLVTPGWLATLMRCAETTGAAVVGPLYIEGDVRDVNDISGTHIHMAGGKAHTGRENGEVILYDEHLLAGLPLNEHLGEVVSGAYDYLELHALLVRTDVLEQAGPFDEQLLSIHEHIDFCFRVRELGEVVFMQSEAKILYVPPPTACDWTDFAYYMLRWSEHWNRSSAAHFNRKHQVTGVRFFGDKSSLQEDSIIKFGRAERRRLSGLKMTLESPPQSASAVQEAELMIALLMSMERERFDVSLECQNQTLERLHFAEPRALLDELPTLLRAAQAGGQSVCLSSVRPEGDDAPVVLCVDDLDRDGLSQLQSHAFLILQTNIDRWQCWLAVLVGAARGAIAARMLSSATAIDGTSHSACVLAGSSNHRNGANFPVRVAAAQMGMVHPLKVLQGQGLTHYLWGARKF